MSHCKSSADAQSRGANYEERMSVTGLLNSGVLTNSVCKNKPASLLVVGGGGGGSGFRLQSAGVTSSIFGGGVGVSFSAAHPGTLAAFQRKCGRGKDSPAIDYNAVAAGMDACRQKCLRGPLTAFWPCNCPCMNVVYETHGMTFAKNLKCDST
jgi:hypothetical protein